MTEFVFVFNEYTLSVLFVTLGAGIWKLIGIGIYIYQNSCPISRGE